MLKPHSTSPPAQQLSLFDSAVAADPGSATTTTAALERPYTVSRVWVSLVRDPVGDLLLREHDGRLDRPAAAAEMLRDFIARWDREILGVLFLDARQRFTGYHIAHIGTRNRCAVEPRGIFTAALKASAARIMVFHNHPSGDPSPSVEDLEFTRRLAEIGDLLAIPLVDHIILGADNAWISLRRRGAW